MQSRSSDASGQGEVEVSSKEHAGDPAHEVSRLSQALCHDEEVAQRLRVRSATTGEGFPCADDGETVG